MKRTTVILSLIFALAIALSASIPTLAANFSTVTVSGNIPKTLEVATVSGTPVTLLLTASGTVDSTAALVNVSVTTNVKKWHLGVTTNNSGYMINSSDSTQLASALNIKSSGAYGGAWHSLAGATTIMTKSSGGAGFWPISDIAFQQTTTIADPAGDYSILITFTGTED